MRGKLPRVKAWLVICAVTTLLLVAVYAGSANGAPSFSCPVSHVHYARDGTVSGGLRSIPWVAAAPFGRFHAHLFFYGATPWPRLHLVGARIFTTVKRRAVSPKVLWTPLRPGAGAELVILGRRLDKPGLFTSRYPRASGNQFPSYVSVPAAGCWRVTVRSGSLAGSVTFAAVDTY
jgi:hypothetical protein